MKRFLISLLTCLMVIFSTGIGAACAQANTLAVLPMLVAETPAEAVGDLMTQLEKEILPQLEKIFNADQLEQFTSDLAEGMSFRKAFKSLALTPEQKTQLKTLFSSISKKDSLASLTPEQKKQLFMKKKNMFKPTAEEISEKIDAAMKEKGIELPAGVKEKIDAAMKQKDTFIPTEEAIAKKIKAGMNTVMENMPE
jgi:hypothetical protein